ncbi:MAG: hypothetical protein ACRYGF_12965 [Janthinobacterium lividum]
MTIHGVEEVDVCEVAMFSMPRYEISLSCSVKSGRKTYVAQGQVDGALGRTNSYTFPNETVLHDDLGAVGIKLNRVQSTRLRCGEAIDIHSNELVIRLLGLWEPQ